MEPTFKMVAKTLKGLEATLADELRHLGAANVEPGRRMVSFEGDLEMMYRANLCLRTALRILKPVYTFRADDTDQLYDRLKEFDWGSLMTADNTFAVDVVMNSDSFSHSRFATYRVKDAIVDWFRDRFDKRPNVRIDGADFIFNLHIQGSEVTLSLDSSGESLHKRGWRVASTEAPINEVLAAGILLMSGYDGSQPLVDPMCGSGTFLVEGALIAANINPGVFRMNYAFRNWPDYDEDLFYELWNNDSAERTPTNIIMGADMLRAAVDATRRNLKAAGVDKFVSVEVRNFADWTEAPAPSGIMVMNPPYGERIGSTDMESLYALIGTQLKKLFAGWSAWIISLKDRYFANVGLAPSRKVALLNGSLECELREYVLFAGNKRDFRASGGRLKEERKAPAKGATAAKKTFAKKPGAKPVAERKKAGFVPKADPVETPSENPLAARRNAAALKSLVNREPSLPKTDGPIMRQRGWKKKQS